jgi:ADP-heptose:LPS heptosyltransferase
MDPQENILLIRLRSIGDILFTLPAVHAVRENFPRAKIHFLVSGEYAPLLRGFADVDEIIPLDRAAFHSGNLQAVCTGTAGLLRDLRRRNFSLAIDFHGHGETALLGWWTGAPERWGGFWHASRGWLYTRGACYQTRMHSAERNLWLLRQCGLRPGAIRNEYVVPADALAEARRFLAANNLDAGKPILFLQPFTSDPAKNWPLENYLKLGWHWHSRGVQILFSGGISDRAALEPARAAGFSISAGTSLPVSAGLMKLSALVVGGDTGLLHLAVAMDRRVVMLMQSTAPGWSHPFGHRDWAVLPPEGKPVAEIPIAAVTEACERAFGDSGVCH